jgi:transcription initiation factor TFIID subunit 6
MALDKRSAAIAAENLGIRDIDPEACEFFAQEAEYQVRAVLEVARNYMRKSRRQRLKAQDLQRAIQQFQQTVSPKQPLLGYPSKAEVAFMRLPQAEELWVVEDPEVNLVDYIANEGLLPPKEPVLHTHWLAIQGRRPNIPENQTESLGEEPSLQAAALESVDVVAGVKHELSEELRLYYNTVLEALTSGCNTPAVEESLRSDSGISQLLPYLTSTFYATVQETDDLAKLARSMKLLFALSMNPHLNIEPYLHQVVPLYLSTLLRVNYEDAGHWSFRAFVAKITAQAIDRFTGLYPSLRPRVLQFLQGVLLDQGKPKGSHYGAIKAIFEFGGSAAMSLIVPQMAEVNAVMSTSTDQEGVSNCRQAIVEGFKQMVHRDKSLYDLLADLVDEPLVEEATHLF